MRSRRPRSTAFHGSLASDPLRILTRIESVEMAAQTRITYLRVTTVQLEEISRMGRMWAVSSLKRNTHDVVGLEGSEDFSGSAEAEDLARAVV